MDRSKSSFWSPGFGGSVAQLGGSGGAAQLGGAAQSYRFLNPFSLFRFNPAFNLFCQIFLEENLSQHCQLPKLCLHGELWGRGNLLHIFSVQLEGKQQMIALKELENVETQGGASDGTCAAGFGTCCTFLAPCDSETTQNGTYFSR